MQIERSDDGVGPIAVMAGDHVRRRGDTRGVDLLDLIRIGEDVAELSGKQLHFRAVELEMGKRGNGLDLRAAELSGHGKC